MSKCDTGSQMNIKGPWIKYDNGSSGELEGFNE